ncbi:MAG: PPOX class F420-dependent oxidoreductase [Actinomycetota bacterium]|nr:PPOX class F420-dependent oxidoreductase [Actinomycetota bacterium]
MAEVLSRDDIDAFLRANPARPAMLATVRSDGRAHVAPVWYEVDDDGSIVFNTGAETVKGRNLLHSGRASLAVQDDRPPYSFVTIEGPVTISHDVADVRPWAARIGGRYLGPDRAEEMGQPNGVPGELVVHLTPEHAVGVANLTA